MNFYASLKAVYGFHPSGFSPLLGTDGITRLTDKNRKWAENFDNVLNPPSEISEEAIVRLDQIPINYSLAKPPCILEVEEAICSLSSKNTPSSDLIPAEIYAARSPQLITKFTKLFQ